MEFFRWVLILAGIAMLAATFFLGRRKVESIDYRRRIAEQDEFDPSIDDLSVPIASMPDDRDESEDYNDNLHDSQIRYEPRGYADDEEFLADDEIDEVIPDRQSPLAANDADDDMGIEDIEAPVSKRVGSVGKVKSFANAVKQASQRKSKTVETPSMMADELEPYSESPSYEPEEKLVTLHITAKDRKFTGEELKHAFDTHGYNFGKMSIYHCSHEKQKVFSVVNMVKPGIFDLDNIDQFSTPGITLFMRLPVSLDADVAFEFLLREATELAEELDGQLRDSDRNTLTQQTIRHLHEDIQQYSFRQKALAHA